MPRCMGEWVVGEVVEVAGGGMGRKGAGQQAIVMWLGALGW